MKPLPARSWVLVAATLLSANACGLSASPAADLQFAPPPGWRASPAIMGFMQFWRPPSDDREVLMLLKSPKSLQSSDFFSQAHDTVRNVTVERRERIVICGDQRATLVRAHGSSSNGEDERIDMLATNAAGNTYFAMYARPISSQPNANAEAALRELCPKT